MINQLSNITSPPPFEKFKKILNLAKSFTENNGAKFYFVYMPDYNRYAISKIFLDLKNFYYYEKVLLLLNDLNIPVIDINIELLTNHKDPLSLWPFRQYGHYNESGYKFVAETILKKIREFERTKNEN